MDWPGRDKVCIVGVDTDPAVSREVANKSTPCLESTVVDFDAKVG